MEVELLNLFAKGHESSGEGGAAGAVLAIGIVWLVWKLFSSPPGKDK